MWMALSSCRGPWCAALALGRAVLFFTLPPQQEPTGLSSPERAGLRGGYVCRADSKQFCSYICSSTNWCACQEETRWLFKKLRAREEKTKPNQSKTIDYNNKSTVNSLTHAQSPFSILLHLKERSLCKTSDVLEFKLSCSDDTDWLDLLIKDWFMHIKLQPLFTCQLLGMEYQQNVAD